MYKRTNLCCPTRPVHVAWRKGHPKKEKRRLGVAMIARVYVRHGVVGLAIWLAGATHVKRARISSATLPRGLAAVVRRRTSTFKQPARPDQPVERSRQGRPGRHAVRTRPVSLRWHALPTITFSI